MGDPLLIAAGGAARVAPLAGRQLENFRRRDVVKNLFREVGKELKRNKSIPRGKRKRVRKRVARLRENGEFLALLRAYIENPRGELLKEIRVDIDARLCFEDPDIADAGVVEVVVSAIERSVPRAQRDPRDAGFANRLATIDAIRTGNDDLKDHLSRELAADRETHVEARRARSERIAELDRAVAPGDARPGTAGVGGHADPERHLDTLAEADPDAGRRLRDAWAKGGVAGLLALTHTPEEWLAGGKPVVWVAIGRLLGQGGEFEAAERAFLAAAERDEADPARQLVRAASWARVRGDERGATDLISQAAAMPGGEGHPAVRIAKAQETIDRPREMLATLADVAPANAAERAGLETLRAQGYLLLGERGEAEAAVERALVADPELLGAKELKGLMLLMGEQERVGNGARADETALGEAADIFAELRDALKSQKRFAESGQVAARRIQALLLLEAPELEHALEELEEEELSLDVAIEIARSALGSQRADLALRALAAQPDTPLVRMLGAAAQLGANEGADPESAATELRSFLESVDAAEEDRGLAAFALLSSSLEYEEIEWNDDALAILAAKQPVPAAILQAEHLLATGDPTGAETALLKHGTDATILQRLAILAAENEDWPTALERSRALAAQDPGPGNLFNRAQILRGAGELRESEETFLRLARSAGAERSLRGRAFDKATEVAIERDDYDAALRVVEEWLEAEPEETERALWLKAFVLARLARYDEALEVIGCNRLEAVDLEQARLVAMVHHRTGPVVDALEAIAELSERFDRDDEMLEALVLFTALRRGGRELPSHLAARVREGFESFPLKFPNSKAIWTMEAPKTPEEFDAFAKSLAAGRDPVERAAASVADGRAAVAILGALAGRTVGEAFLRLEVLPLGYGDPSLDELERNDAREALGSGAVWDPASIFVVGGLEARVGEAIRGALPGSALAQATLDDCDVGSGSADDGSEEITEIGYDSKRATGRISAWSALDSERERRRSAGMLELARELQVVPDADAESEGRWNRLLAEEHEIPPTLLTWPATLAVAERTGLPVFSDDRYIRLAARREGLRAFGTVALLDALVERRLIDPAQREEARLRLLRSRAWGMRPDLGEIARMGAETGWEPSAALWRVLSDRGFWMPEVMDAWRTVVGYLHEVWSHAPEELSDWVARCLDAAAAAIPRGRSIHPDAMLVAALEVGVAEPRLPDLFLRALLDALRATPPYPGEPDLDVLLSSLGRIAAAVRGLPGGFQVFIKTLGRFSLYDQEPAIEAFLAERER